MNVRDGIANALRLTVELLDRQEDMIAKIRGSRMSGKIPVLARLEQGALMLRALKEQLASMREGEAE